MNWQQYLNTFGQKYGQQIETASAAPFDFVKIKPEPLATGNFFRTYLISINQKPYIIKVFREDLRIYLKKNFALPVHLSLLDIILKIAGRHLRPSTNSITLHLQEKAILEKYFAKVSLRDFPQTLKIWNKALVNSQNRNTQALYERLSQQSNNFIPQGWTITQKQQNKLQLYLIQEFIDGSILENLPHQSWPINLREKLVIFCLLCLCIERETGIVVDTSPADLLRPAKEWFHKTNNILVDKNTNTPVYIDTWWLWNSQKGRLYNFIYYDQLILKSQRNTLIELVHSLI